jgi:hypothetical protein
VFSVSSVVNLLNSTVGYASRTFLEFNSAENVENGTQCVPYRATSCMTHRDVVAAIAPVNLAAFPPSLEVNADIA